MLFSIISELHTFSFVEFNMRSKAPKEPHR